MLCQRKHTKYQPTDEQWKCPKCGAGAGDFFIDDPDECYRRGEPECDLLHTDVWVTCECGFSQKATTFARNLVRKLDLVKCSCCKGTGWVKKS